MKSGTISELWLLISLLISVPSTFIAIEEFNADYHPLQTFRSSVDPSGAALYSWTRTPDPCSGNWVGVACRGGRVTRILLPGLSLQGTVDDSLTFLPYLRLLNLSHNHLTGELPEGFLRLRRLRRIDFSANSISGHIPAEISYLPRLITLRLQGNLLAGEIPYSLGSFSVISDLNISANRLSGEIPFAISSFPVSSFSGNEKLCRKPLQRQCTHSTEGREPFGANAVHEKNGGWKWNTAATIAVAAVSGVVFSALVLLLFIICRRKRRKPAATAVVQRENATSEGPVAEDKRVVRFEGCKPFTADHLMKGSAEMLGRGSVGSTYRVVMEGETGSGVAVKRLRRVKKAAEDRDSAAAIELLLTEISGLRHPNVVPLRAYYHSQDELLLVYDYLPNGSLHSLLHGNRGPARTPLYWAARMKLALSAAQGLAFLHAASPSKLAHQKLNSSNILVDGNGEACITDFALLHLRSVARASPATNRTAAGRESDVYYFGVILLEILTGKAPAKEEPDLPKWVQTVVEETWGSDLFDVDLLACKEKEDEMVGLLQVALLCLALSPGDRPTMRVVYKMIEEIGERGSKRGRIGGSCTPISSSSMNDDSRYLGSSTPVSEYTTTFLSG